VGGKYKGMKEWIEGDFGSARGWKNRMRGG